MNKRELLHMLLDSVLDIEETSKKGVCFEYSTLHNLSIRFKTRPDIHADTIKSTCYLFKLDGDDIVNAITFIEQIKNTPDVEPKLSFTLDESKARELGLIA